MRAESFWKAVVEDRSDLLDTLLALFREQGVRYCLIGGQAVNAYVEPLVSLDLDIVVAVGQLPTVEAALRERFGVERFPHSLNVSQSGSALRVQIQTDPRYGPFVARAAVRDVLGVPLPVAAIKHVLQGKVWVASDATRRPSKRRKDLLDIERLVEAYPHLRERAPAAILPGSSNAARSPAPLIRAVWAGLVSSARKIHRATRPSHLVRVLRVCPTTRR